MSRRAKLVIAVSGVAIIAAVGVYYALGTPHYTLYLLGRALQRGDAEGVARFIDVERLAASAVAAEVERLAETGGAGGAWEKTQSNVQARYAQLASAALLQSAREELRRALASIGTKPPAAASSDWELKGVSRSGSSAHVEIARTSDGTVVGFDMEQQPDRTWKIVRADPREMAALME